MSMRVMWMAALVGLGLATGGCDMNRRAQTVPLGGLEATAELASAPLAVDIENWSGTVVVKVDRGAREPRVTARPADGRSVKKDDKPWAAAEMVAEEGHRVLRVVAGGGEEPAAPVIVTVTVPGCDGVRVRNAGGPVTLRGVGGAIAVVNTDLGGRKASITLDTKRDLTMPVSLTSTGGDVRCTAGSGTAGRVTLTAPKDKLEVRVKAADRFTDAVYSARGWTAVFAGSENPITLTTDDGIVAFELY